jgi:hypothetical protein
MRVELARAHERAHLVAHAVWDAPKGQRGLPMYAQERDDFSSESRPVIGVEEEGERVAKRSVHLDASENVRWEENG